MSPQISLIAAIGKYDRELGKNNQLIWRIPEDLAYFKKVTSGHTVIMGRKTYESIGRPLPNRTNIIITRQKNYSAPHCIVSENLTLALHTAKTNEERHIFIIGGGEIFTKAIDMVDTLYLTLIDARDPDADVFFPEYEDHFRLQSTVNHTNHIPSYAFTQWRKK